MIDAGKFVLDHDNSIFFSNCSPFEKACFYYVPVYSRRIRDRVAFYEGRFKNVVIRIHRDHVTLLNSCHKYYCGNNYSDFGIADVERAVSSLSFDSGFDWQNSVVKKAEYGINITMDKPIDLNFLVSYKGAAFNPMIAKNGEVYGVKSKHSEYQMKFYDKSLEAKLNSRAKLKDLPDHVYRWEIAYEDSRFLHDRSTPINFVKVRDIWDYEVFQSLAIDLIDKFDSCKIVDGIQFLEGRSVNDLKVISALESRRIRDALQEANPRTYKRDMKRYREMQNDHTGLRNVVTEKLIDKATYLMNQNYPELVV